LKNSKKIFFVLAGMFFVFMIILGYDISKRTTFPGSKKLLIESIAPSDSVLKDSTTYIHKDSIGD